MLNFALVGLGWWGGELAQAIQRCPDRLRLASCYAPPIEEREAFAVRFGTNAAASFEQILDDPTIDAVLLATPHSTHAEQIIRAVGAGKHVFVEKPFTLSIESGQKAMRAAEENGRVLAVGHNRRLSGGARHLKSMLGKGQFGKVLHVEANYSVNSAMNYRVGAWRADRREALGGALASLGLHMVDTMSWLFGPVRRVTCLARHVAVPVDIDDATVGILEFRSGVTATLTTLFASPLTSHMRISGTTCVADMTDDFSALVIVQADGSRHQVELDQVDTLVTELDHFANACLTGAKLSITPAEALQNVAVLEAMVASAAQAGRWHEVSSIRAGIPALV